MKSVQGGCVMPVYRAGVDAGDASRGGDTVGSTEYGRRGGGGRRGGSGGLLTDMRDSPRQQRRRPSVRMMGDCRRDRRRRGAMMTARARARARDRRDVAVRLLIRLP